MKPFWILGAGVLLRAALASLRIDRVWADEHYQTLEPAYYLLHGYGYLSWEWKEGFRSWSLPALHTPALALSWCLGFKGGLGATIIARLVYAILDAWIWYRLTHWIFSTETPEKHERSALQKNLFLAIALLSPTLALWGVTTLQDHLAWILFWGWLPTLLDWTVPLEQNRHPKKKRARLQSSQPDQSWRYAITGFVLFSIAIPKPQMALLCLGTAAGILWLVRDELFSREGRKALLAAIAGSLGAGALAGIIDWFTTGRFAGTLINQLTRGEEISRNYGVSPFSEYGMKLPELIGWGTILTLPVLALLTAMVGPIFRARQLLVVTWPGILLFVFVHHWIPHKEIRFLLPIVPVFFLAALAFKTPDAFSKFLGLQKRILRILDLKIPAIVPILLLLGSFWASLQLALHRPLYYSSVEIGQLEDWIRKDWKTAHTPSVSSSPPPIKLCVLGGNWSYMRGSLALEAPVVYMAAFHPHELETLMPQVTECHYAIVKQGWNFSSITANPEIWKKIELSQNKFELFKQESALNPP